MKIYLVRHGQSVGNVKNLWYGSTVCRRCTSPTSART